jgi:serine/threonine protein phosphatase PrpC
MLAAHGVTHTGRRATNEDTMLVEPGIGLFVVADGMGGHNAGEIASALAVRTLHDFIAAGDGMTPHALAEGLRLANDEILTAAGASPEYDGMGTTVVSVIARGDRLVYGSVGDSRLYLWRGGRLTQLTQDDTWISRVLPADALGTADALAHPMRHVLTKVVGVRGDLDPAVGDDRLDAGDTLLLCSDGLHGTVDAAAIARTLAAEPSVQHAAQSLLDQALAGGATDNITVVVIRKQEEART